MINASLVAMEINNALPAMETPRGTEDYEGFYHLVSMSGDVSEASLNYIVRDHDKNLFEAKKNTLRLIEKNRARELLRSPLKTSIRICPKSLRAA